jgi:UDP-glucose 4-epimerase
LNTQLIQTQVVFASSGGTVYSGNDLPFSENSIANGANEYGKSKLSMEKALLSSAKSSTILRISNAYGPGQRLDRGQGVIGTWLNEIKQGNPITVFGAIDNVRDFIFVDDVIDAIVATINNSDSSGVFNIGSSIGISLENVISEIRGVTESDFEINQRDSRSVDRKAIWLDISKARRDLNWNPKVTLKNGLQTTWRYILQTQK